LYFAIYFIVADILLLPIFSAVNTFKYVLFLNYYFTVKVTFMALNK